MEHLIDAVTNVNVAQIHAERLAATRLSLFKDAARPAPRDNSAAVFHSIIARIEAVSDTQ